MDECIFVNIESLSRLKRPVNVFSVRAILCNYFRLTAESDGERGPISTGTINLRLKLLISIQMLLFFPPCHTTNTNVHLKFDFLYWHLAFKV